MIRSLTCTVLVVAVSLGVAPAVALAGDDSGPGDSSRCVSDRSSLLRLINERDDKQREHDNGSDVLQGGSTPELDGLKLAVAQRRHQVDTECRRDNDRHGFLYRLIS